MPRNGRNPFQVGQGQAGAERRARARHGGSDAHGVRIRLETQGAASASAPSKAQGATSGIKPDAMRSNAWQGRNPMAGVTAPQSALPVKQGGENLAGSASNGRLIASLPPDSGRAPVRAREDSPLDFADEADLLRAREQFKAFARTWMMKVNTHYAHNRHKSEIVQDGATFIAQYPKSHFTTLTTRVKRSGSSSTPFVGVMRYLESTYQSRGPSPEKAQAGEFKAVKSRYITEIFTYADGEWVY